MIRGDQKEKKRKCLIGINEIVVNVYDYGC